MGVARECATLLSSTATVGLVVPTRPIPPCPPIHYCCSPAPGAKAQAQIFGGAQVTTSANHKSRCVWGQGAEATAEVGPEWLPVRCDDA